MTTDQNRKRQAELDAVDGEFATLTFKYQRLTRDLQRPGITPEARNRVEKERELIWQQGSEGIAKAREILKEQDEVPR